MNRIRQPVVITLFALAFVACGEVPPASKERADGKLSAFVSVPPQAGFVKAIGGDHVVVTSFAGEGQDPHQITVQPKQMAALARAHVYFSVGMPFEETLLKKIRDQKNAPVLVDTTEGIKRLSLGEHDHADHAHAHHGHDHGDSDPHIWLAPEKIKTQAKTIADALKDLAPQHAVEFDANLDKFIKELDALDLAISEKMDPLLGETFYVYHPAFGYFADAYGLYQEPVETGGQSPTPKALAEFIKHATDDGAKIIFVQPQFDQSNAETVAEAIGGSVVPLDPLAENVLENLKTIADHIAAALASP